VTRDVEVALKFLFPQRAEQARALLETLRDGPVKWAVLALSEGKESKLASMVREAESDYRNPLMWANSQSREPKGPTVRALPAAEELAFAIHARELERLGFFDRLVRAGAAVFDPPRDPLSVVRALTARAARSFRDPGWREVPLETARFLLLHVMQRSFTAAEMARAPLLLAEFESFAEVKGAFASNDPNELPLQPDGRQRLSPGPLNYQVGVVLLGHARAWGLWMEHGAG
jgi:hypothetical protein